MRRNRLDAHPSVIDSVDSSSSRSLRLGRVRKRAEAATRRHYRILVSCAVLSERAVRLAGSSSFATAATETQLLERAVQSTFFSEEGHAAGQTDWQRRATQTFTASSTALTATTTALGGHGSWLKINRGL